jgi:hypothetical protein
VNEVVSPVPPASQRRHTRFEEVDHFLWMMLGALSFGARIEQMVAGVSTAPAEAVEPGDDATADVLLGVLALRARLLRLVADSTGPNPLGDSTTTDPAGPARPGALRELRR